MALKRSILKRVLPPSNERLCDIVRETGISESTIRYWIDHTRNFDEEEKNPRSYSNQEKYQILIESSKIPSEKMGEYLREKGLHSEHLMMWDQELKELLGAKEIKVHKKNNALKKQNRELVKELQRKDKALAETAALLVLKKKLDLLWEDEEDD